MKLLYWPIIVLAYLFAQTKARPGISHVTVGRKKPFTIQNTILKTTPQLTGPSTSFGQAHVSRRLLLGRCSFVSDGLSAVLKDGNTPTKHAF